MYGVHFSLSTVPHLHTLPYTLPHTHCYAVQQTMPTQQRTGHNTSSHHGDGGSFFANITLCFLFFLLLVRRQFSAKKPLVAVGCIAAVLVMYCRTITRLGGDVCNQGEECTNPDGTTFYPTCFKPDPNPLTATINTLYPSGIAIYMDDERPGQNFLVFNATFDLKSPQRSCKIQSEIFNLAFGEDVFYYHAETYEPGEVTPFVQIVPTEYSNQLLHSFKVHVDVLCWADHDDLMEPRPTDSTTGPPSGLINNFTAVYRFSQYHDRFECATQ